MLKASTSDPKYRVKVYELNEEGDWADKGTGHVQFQVVQTVDAAYMYVHSEENSSLLLESKIFMDDDAYQRQGDTIISWHEPYSRQDLALSFAEATGCQDIWEKLCAVRGVDPSLVQAAFEDDRASSQQHHTLPAVSPTNLGAILQYFTELSPFMREGVAATILQDDYIKKLTELFVTLEANRDADRLRMMFLIFRAFVLMNERNLLENLMHDDNYLLVFGILEYDPDLVACKPNHRLFLSTVVKFRQIVPFQPKLVLKVHQNFRLQYLKDVVLPRALDDATFATINSVVFFSSIEIIQEIQNDSSFISDLFARFHATRLSTTPESYELQASVIGLIQEMCNLSKVLQIDARATFLKMLQEQRILQIFELALAHPTVKTRISALDVLNLFVNQDASAVRVFMLGQEPSYQLLNELMKKILVESDHGTKGHVCDILRRLLDPQSMEQSQEKNPFLNIFYEVFMDQLISVFNQDFAKTFQGSSDDYSVTKHLVCELLTFFVLHHGYRIKYFVLRNNVVGKICELLADDEKFIALAAVRFMRACVGLKDEFYFRYMIKNNSFLPLVQLFKKNVKKYNLVNSAILELFDFIRKENIKSLVTYIADQFQADLSAVTYVETFSALWILNEKHREFAASGGRIPGTVQEREMSSQDAEELYFNREDGPDRDVVFVEATNAATPTALVPYDDDDDALPVTQPPS